MRNSWGNVKSNYVQRRKSAHRGDVDIVITYLTDEEKQDETLWGAQFAATPGSAFERLIEQGVHDFRAGETDDFDPTHEDD